MLQWLTPSERRGATVLVLLLVLGAGHDAWIAHRMRAEMTSTPIAPRPAEDSSTQAVDSMLARSPDPAPATARIDVNRASAEELDRLPGIGPVLARRIVDARRSGRFEIPEDLLRVRGVGPRLLERLRPRIRIGMHSAPSPDHGRADSASAAPTPSR